MNNRNVGPEEGSWGSAWHGLEEIPAIRHSGGGNFPSKAGNCHRCCLFLVAGQPFPQKQVKFELSPPFARYCILRNFR